MRHADCRTVTTRSFHQVMGRHHRPAALALASLVVLAGRAWFGVSAPAEGLALGELALAVWVVCSWWRSRRPWTWPGLSHALGVVLLAVVFVPVGALPSLPGADRDKGAVAPVAASELPDPTPTATATPTPTPTPTPTSTSTPTPEPTQTPTPEPTQTPPPTPTSSLEPEPERDAAEAEADPTELPTAEVERAASESEPVEPTATEAPTEAVEPEIKATVVVAAEPEQTPAPTVTAESVESAADSGEVTVEADPAPDADTPQPEGLAPGSAAVVANAGGFNVRLRAAPGYDAETLALLPEGTMVGVFDGPFVAADGSGWYHVAAEGQIGYIVEDFLAPTATPVPEGEPDGSDLDAPVVEAGSGAFAPGDSAVIANAGGHNVRLRSAPGYDAVILTLFPEGTVVNILDGPFIAADDSLWYRVEVEGERGYIVEDFLAPVGSPEQEGDLLADVIEADGEFEAEPEQEAPLATPLAETPVVAAATSADEPQTEPESDPEPVTVQALTPDDAVSPGQSARYRFRVQNQTDESVSVLLDATNTLAGWDLRLYHDDGQTPVDGPVTIPAEDEVNVVVEVTVPWEARVNEQNTTSVRALALTEEMPSITSASDRLIPDEAGP